MIVRALTECGDIATRGTQFARDVNAIELLVKMRLKLYLGEYFRNINDGTPWWQDILGKQANRSRGEQLIRARIAQTPGVTQILDFNVNYDEREMFIQCSFDTVYGVGALNYGTNNE